MTTRDRLAGLTYSAGWSLVKSLPESAAQLAFRQAADLTFARRGRSVRQLARNLRRVLGAQATPTSLAEVTKAGMRSYARYWMETFRLESMDLPQVGAMVSAASNGIEYVHDAVQAGRGIILALPHSGNWDVAGLMICQNFGGLTTVAERLRPESLYDRFVAYREHLGMEILPLTGGDVPASKVLKERLRQGRVVCLVADRDLTRNGVEVDFFGEQTRMPAGPAMLAAVTGADLVPAHLYFTPTGWGTTFGGPLSLPGQRLREQIASGTQQLADFFATNIAAHPADWHMLSRLWLADLSDEHRAHLSEAA